MKLVKLDLSNKKTLDWLYAFVQAHHSSPTQVLPSKSCYLYSTKHFFKVVNRAVIGVTGYTELSPTHAEIEKTIIHPRQRGKKYGEQVSQMIVDHLQKKGYKKVKSIIYAQNLPMLFIRLKQGFLVEGLIRNGDAPGLHEYHLGKEL